MHKLLIVDDHQVLIDGIKALFEHNEEIDICAEALNGQAAIDAIAQQEIDIVMLDINLPDKSGIEVCQLMKQQQPDIKIIALTMHNEAGYIHIYLVC